MIYFGLYRTRVLIDVQVLQFLISLIIPLINAHLYVKKFLNNTTRSEIKLFLTIIPKNIVGWSQEHILCSFSTQFRFEGKKSYA